MSQKNETKKHVEPKLLDRRQLSEFLSISPAKISRMWSSGQMPKGMLVAGKSRRWNRDEIVAWANQQCPNQEEWEKLKPLIFK